MTIALFCQFSSPLLDGGLQLSQLISTESAYLLSPDTAIAYVESEDVAAFFVLKGTEDLLQIWNHLIATSSVIAIYKCRGNTAGRQEFCNIFVS